MSDSEDEPSLPPPSPATATEVGGAIILVQEPEIDACEEFISQRLVEHTRADYSKEEPMFSIPRVPNRLRRGENDAYEPEIISIGPYHRGNPRLQAMEKEKFQHLSGILSQNSNFSLKDFIRKLRPMEGRVRRCYSDNINLSSNSNEFVEMMLLDSCFIVHLLLKAIKDAKNLDGMIWRGSLMLYDLLLLENQLPFFLVQFVFDITNCWGECSSSLVELAYRFYALVTHHKNIYKDECTPLPPTEEVPHLLQTEQVHHLLQLYHWFNVSAVLIHPSPQKPISKWINFIHIFHVLKRFKPGRSSIDYDNITTTMEEEPAESGFMIPNATLLHEVGIKFRRRKGSSILDVKFSDGVLEIPPLFIHDGSVSQFQNLIALEQCIDYYFYSLPQFTAYFKFMDHIINTVSDVALLQKNGIIEHSYGCEKEVARLFNQLTSGATINPDNYLSGLYKDVNKYCKKKRHIWCAIFLRRHCSNPWAILSLIGALILLVLTFLQSYFSVFSYYRPSSKSP